MAPVSSAVIPLVVSCGVTSSGRPSMASSTWSRVTGSSLPTSGHSCNVLRSSTVALSRSLASSRTVVNVVVSRLMAQS